MPIPVSLTRITALPADSRRRTSTRAAAGRELDGVREQVPDHLLQAVGVAERPGSPAGRVETSSAIPLASAAGRTVSRAASMMRRRSTGLKSSRSLPVMMRETSSRSSMSCACARALRSMVSRARAAAAGVELARAQQLRPAEDGVERRAQLVREGGQELVLDAVGLLGLPARRLLEDEQAGPLLLGPLADADLPLQLLVGHRQLGRPLLDQHLEIVVHPAQGRVGLGELGGALARPCAAGSPSRSRCAPRAAAGRGRCSPLSR